MTTYIFGKYFQICIVLIFKPKLNDWKFKYVVYCVTNIPIKIYKISLILIPNQKSHISYFDLFCIGTTGTDAGLPTILETNSLKNSTRPLSLSDKRGSVRSLMQGLSNAQRRFSPTEHQGNDKFESISLTMNPE